MTESIQNTSIKITGNTTDVVTIGHVRIQIWTKSMRIKRSLKTLSLCWLAALAAVVVPMLHFVLVPLLIVAGPITAFFIFRQTSMILGGEGVCPFCAAPLSIAKTSNHFPQEDLCVECRHNVSLILNS